MKLYGMEPFYVEGEKRDTDMLGDNTGTEAVFMNHAENHTEKLRKPCNAII